MPHTTPLKKQYLDEKYLKARKKHGWNPPRGVLQQEDCFKSKKKVAVASLYEFFVKEIVLNASENG